VGAALTIATVWTTMPSIMISEVASPLGVDETVAKIKANAEAAGWVIPSIQPLNKAIKKHGGGKLPPIILINLCQANHAYNTLKNDSDRKISIFMPCTISVYQKDDGNTYLAVMNADLLGQMFGGNVAVVMKEVAAAQRGFIAFATDE